MKDEALEGIAVGSLEVQNSTTCRSNSGLEHGVIDANCLEQISELLLVMTRHCNFIALVWICGRRKMWSRPQTVSLCLIRSYKVWTRSNGTWIRPQADVSQGSLSPTRCDLYTVHGVRTFVSYLGALSCHESYRPKSMMTIFLWFRPTLVYVVLGLLSELGNARNFCSTGSIEYCKQLNGGYLDHLQANSHLWEGLNSKNNLTGIVHEFRTGIFHDWKFGCGCCTKAGNPNSIARLQASCPNSIANTT